MVAAASALALTAGVLANIDSILAFVDSSNSDLSVPPISLRLINSGDSPKEIGARGDFFLWLPGPSGHHTIGKYELREANVTSGVVVVEPGAEVHLKAQVLNEKLFGSILDQGECDLSLALRDTEGGMLFSGNLPFTRSGIAKYYLAVDVARETGVYPNETSQRLEALAEQASADPPYYGDSSRGNVRPQMEAYLRSFVFSDGSEGEAEVERLLKAIDARAHAGDPTNYFNADNVFRAELEAFRSKVRIYARTGVWPRP